MKFWKPGDDIGRIRLLPTAQGLEPWFSATYTRRVKACPICEFQKTRKSEMNPPNIGDEPIGGVLDSILTRAIRKAREISKREIVKADRAERVGIFKTCLRQEILQSSLTGVWRNYLIDRLANARLWYDIGVLQFHSVNRYLSAPQRSWGNGSRRYPDAAHQLSRAQLEPILEEVMTETLDDAVRDNLRELHDLHEACQQEAVRAEIINAKAVRVEHDLLIALESGQ